MSKCQSTTVTQWVGDTNHEHPTSLMATTMMETTHGHATLISSVAAAIGTLHGNKESESVFICWYHLFLSAWAWAVCSMHILAMCDMHMRLAAEFTVCVMRASVSLIHTCVSYFCGLRFYYSHSISILVIVMCMQMLHVLHVYSLTLGPQCIALHSPSTGMFLKAQIFWPSCLIGTVKYCSSSNRVSQAVTQASHTQYDWYRYISILRNSWKKVAKWSAGLYVDLLIETLRYTAGMCSGCTHNLDLGSLIGWISVWNHSSNLIGWISVWNCSSNLIGWISVIAYWLDEDEFVSNMKCSNNTSVPTFHWHKAWKQQCWEGMHSFYASETSRLLLE